MAETIASGSIRIDGDVSDVSAKLTSVEKSIDKLGKSAKKAGTDANAGFSKMGSGGALSKAERQTNSLRGAIERATAATTAGAKGTAAYYRELAKARGADGGALEPYIRNLEAAQSKSSAARAAQDKLAASTRATGSAFSSAGLAVKGFIATMGFREIIQMADGYTKFTAQLKLATRSTTEYATAYGEVKRISSTAQTDLGSVGVLYARIANGTRELGISQQRVSDLTETVSLSLKASGASASESASAMLQLSQAFASGVLRGEEFNAVNEAAPRLMKALADGMGVPIGSLRSLAEQGKITAEVMAGALPQALEQLRKEAKEVETISGSWTVLRNSMMELVGTRAQASGAISAISGSIELLAGNLELLATAALVFGAARVVGSLYTFAAGLRSVAGAATVARAAMAFLGGPIGIATAIITGGVAAWYSYSDGIKESRQSILDFNSNMDEAIEKFRTMNKLQRDSEINKRTAELADQAAKVEKFMVRLRNATPTGISNEFGISGYDDLEKSEKLFKSIDAVVKDVGLSHDQMGNKVGELIARFAEENNILGENRKAMVDNAKEVVEGIQTKRRLSNELDFMTGKTDKLVYGTNKLTSAFRGQVGPTEAVLKKYSEMTEKLREQVDTYGMTATALAKYKAAQLDGISQDQVEYVGILGAQKDKLDEIKKATEEGNDSAVRALREEYKLLVQKEQMLNKQVRVTQAMVAWQRALSDTTAAGFLKSAKAFAEFIKVSNAPASAFGGVNVPASSAGLRIKGSQATGGGATNSGTFAIAQVLQNTLGSSLKHFAAFNDNYHQANRPNSKHTAGLAFDASLTGGANGPQSVKEITDYLTGLGFVKSKDFFAQFEKAGQNGATGDHLHFQWNTKDAADRFAGMAGTPDQRAVEEGEKGRAEKLTAFRLTQIKRESDAKQDQLQTDLRMNELRGKDDAQYYATRKSLTTELNNARINGINAEIALLKQVDNDDNRQKVLDLEAERGKLLNQNRVAMAEINKDQADGWKATSKAISDAQASAQRYVDTLKQNDQRSLDAMGMGDRGRGLADRQNSAADEYLQNVRDLENSYNGKARDESFAKQLESYRYMYSQALILADDYYKREAEERGKWVNGFNRAVQNYSDSAADHAGQMETVFTTVTSGLEDAWVQFVTTGKMSFSDMAKSVIADIARMQAKAAISGLFNMVIGAVAGGFNSSGATTVGGGTMNSFAVPAGGWAEGGYTGPGNKYQIAGPAHKGEVIWSQDDIRNAGGVARVESMRKNGGKSASSGKSGVTIINQTTGRIDSVEERTDSNGDTVLIIQEAVRQAVQAVDNNLANPNSTTSSRLKKGFKMEFAR